MHSDWTDTISGVSRMFWNIMIRNRSERFKAIENGQLVDMQLPPFRQFDEIVNNNFRTVMSKAAYEACVQLPREVRGRAEVPANARWGIVSFMWKFQHYEEDPHEGTFDVNVLLPSGFQVPKTLKVVVDNDFDGENAFVFLMPDEFWPACIAS